MTAAHAPQDQIDQEAADWFARLNRLSISSQALEASAATLRVQEAAVALAEAKLARTQIRAPFTGIVGIRNVSVGDYVKEGQDLVNLEDVATLKVDFRLPEATLPLLRIGQSLEVTVDALPGERFTAELDAIDPLIDAGGRSISLRASRSSRSSAARISVSDCPAKCALR